MTELFALSEDSREEMRKRGAKIGCCPCCSRTVPLTFHHLVPKKVHRRNRYKKLYSKNDLNRGVYLCRRCHKGIHRTFDELTLAEKVNRSDLDRSSRLRATGSSASPKIRWQPTF